MTSNAADPRLWNDLAAAHLVAVEAERNPASPLFRKCPGGSEGGLDELDALEAASRSLALSPSPEARFNRALALEALHLDGQAAVAWEEVEALDPDREWAAEAAERRTALAQKTGPSPLEKGLEAAALRGDAQAAAKLARVDPQRARELAGRDLLWAWGRAIMAGRPGEADRHLAAASALAAPLAGRGDSFAADAVAIVRGADVARRERAARGLSEFADAFPVYRAFDNERAISMFALAQKDLAAAGLPQAFEVELYRAAAENNAGRPKEAADRIDAVEALLKSRDEPGLLALAAWIRAVIAGRDGRPFDQAAEYRLSRDLYARLGEIDRCATADSLLAQALEKLGRGREAWRTYLRAVEVAPQVSDPYRRRTIWGQLAYFAQAKGRFRGGLAFQEEMQRAAAEQGDPNAVNESLLLRASLHAALGDSTKAGADLAQVRRKVTSITDAGDQARTQADLFRIEGALDIERAPTEAVAKLDRAVDHYAKTGQGVLDGATRAVRSRAHVAAGNLAGAEADLGALVAYAERGGQGWLDGAGDEDRYTFGRETRRAFSEMVRFQAVEARRPWRAFAYAETARELLAPHPPSRAGQLDAGSLYQPPALGALRAALPADTVLVEFAVFDDRILSWWVAPEGVASFSTKASREGLTRLVESLDPTKGTLTDEAWKESSARLFDLLLRPYYSRLGPERTLVVVPDGPLSQVPWSGLRDRERDRYVVEDRAVLVDPSASFYLRALARSQELDSKGPIRILVVGDPAFDSKEWPRFTRLPAARKEAAEIGALYGSNATVLTDKRATWDAFRKAALDADVIHLGMHAAPDPVDPFRSFLLFADPGARGARTLRDFAALDLPRTRLAILAACESAGENPEGEGVVGLARPFLAAGVPAVVGSLWQIGDRSTLALTLETHRELEKDADVANAMRTVLRRSCRWKDGTRMNAPYCSAALLSLGATS
ncbi:MAG: CHAT domain-containing protein [Acidobacteriota bacterium]